MCKLLIEYRWFPSLLGSPSRSLSHVFQIRRVYKQLAFALRGRPTQRALDIPFLFQ